MCPCPGPSTCVNIVFLVIDLSPSSANVNNRKDNKFEGIDKEHKDCELRQQAALNV